MGDGTQADSYSYQLAYVMRSLATSQDAHNVEFTYIMHNYYTKKEPLKNHNLFCSYAVAIIAAAVMLSLNLMMGKR